MAVVRGPVCLVFGGRSILLEWQTPSVIPKSPSMVLDLFVCTFIILFIIFYHLLCSCSSTIFYHPFYSHLTETYNLSPLTQLSLSLHFVPYLLTSLLHLCHNHNTPALIAEATVNPYSSHKLYSVELTLQFYPFSLCRTQFIVLFECWKYSPVCQMVSPVTDMYKSIAHYSSSDTYFKSITPKECSAKMSLWNSPSSQWI